MKPSVLISFRRFCASLCLAAPLLWAPTSLLAEAPQVFAYYYPWYVGGDWSRHPYPFEPVIGKYDSGAPEVAARHIDWAADNGIDGLLVSWWGADSPWTKKTAEGLLAAQNIKRIRFAMLYESPMLSKLDDNDDLWFDFASPPLRERFTDDLRKLKAGYFGHPSYWQVGGRPVVVFYLSRNYMNLSAELLQEIQQDAGVELFTIGDEVFFDQQASPDTAAHGAGVFDAYTAYNLLQNHRVRPDDDATSYHLREAAPLYREWTRRATIVPGVFPAYEDFRGNKVLAGNGPRFEELLRAAGQWADANAPEAPRAVFLTSYNEWWEGTTIEPATEYGETYLNAVRAWKEGNADRRER